MKEFMYTFEKTKRPGIQHLFAIHTLYVKVMKQNKTKLNKNKNKNKTKQKKKERQQH